MSSHVGKHHRLCGAQTVSGVRTHPPPPAEDREKPRGGGLPAGGPWGRHTHRADLGSARRVFASMSPVPTEPERCACVHLSIAPAYGRRRRLRRAEPRPPVQGKDHVSVAPCPTLNYVDLGVSYRGHWVLMTREKVYSNITRTDANSAELIS